MARIDRRSKKQIEKFIFKRSSPGTGLVKYTVEIKIKDNDILKKLYSKDKITGTFDSLKEAQAFKNKTIPKLAKQAGVSAEYFLNPNKGMTVLENVKSSLPAKYKNYISSAELEKILGVGPKALSKQGTGALDTSFTAAVKKLLNQVNAQDIAKGAPKGQPYYMYKNPTKEDLALLKKYTINSNVLEGTGYNYAKAPTVKVINALRRDPFFKNFIKDNKVITTEMLTDQNSNLNKFLKRNNISLHQFLNGTLRYAEALKGNFIINLNDPILAENAIKTNKALSSKIYNTLEKSTKGKDMMSPVKTAMYRAAMADISDQLGNQTTTFENYKNALQKRVRQYGFKTAKDVDEIIGVSASARNQLGPYAVFSRILDEDLNRGILRDYQRSLSVRTEKLRNAIAAGNMSEANNLVKKFRNEVYLPTQVKLKQAGQPTNILPELTLSRPTSKTLGGGKGRMTELAKQGLDFEDFFEREKFGFKLPKGATTQKELLKQFATKNVNNICQIFGKAEGGRIGFASGGAGCGVEMAQALDEDPIGTANKVKDIKVEGGAVNRIKNAATAFLKTLGLGKGEGVEVFRGERAGASGKMAKYIPGTSQVEFVPYSDKLKGRFFTASKKVAEQFADNPSKIKSLTIPQKDFNIGTNLARRINVDQMTEQLILPRSVINKLKDGTLKYNSPAFRNILRTLGKGKAFAITAGVGAGAGALVKQFRNDEPDTYLSDENQMKAMLVDTFEEDTLGKAGIGGELAAAGLAVPGSGAVYKARRGKGFGAVRSALGPVGKAASGFATPLGLALTTPFQIASQVRAGDSLEDIATNPLNYLAPAFAGTLTKEATRGMNPQGILAKGLRLGMSPAAVRGVSKFFGLPGLALSLGYEGYDQYKKYQEGEGFIYNLLNKDE